MSDMNGGLLDGVWNSIGKLEAKIAKLELQLKDLVVAPCQHEEFRIDPRQPFYMMAIADERKMAIMTPGQPPPVVFALAICKHCWQTYPVINIVDEFEPAPAQPVKLVNEGDVISD